MAKVVVIGAVGKSVSMDVDRFHVGGETIFAKSAHMEFGGKGFNRSVASARQDVETVFIAACGDEDVQAIEELFASPLTTDGLSQTRVLVARQFTPIFLVSAVYLLRLFSTKRASRSSPFILITSRI